MLMDDAMITKRLVYHIGGYDPATPERVHHRFVRELRHFEMTWSVKSAVSEPEIEADQVAWNIDTAGATSATPPTSCFSRRRAAVGGLSPLPPPARVSLC